MTRLLAACFGARPGHWLRAAGSDHVIGHWGQGMAGKECTWWARHGGRVMGLGNDVPGWLAQVAFVLLAEANHHAAHLAGHAGEDGSLVKVGSGRL